MKSSPALLAWWVLLLPVAAQEEQPSGGEVRESLQALEERVRDELHPAEDPLVIVGREQGDNDLRSRTPALTRSDRVAALVDPEEAYARALALYDGDRFHSAPPSSRPGKGTEPERETSRKKPPGHAEPEAQPESDSGWSSLPLYLVAAVGLAWAFRRFVRR